MRELSDIVKITLPTVCSDMQMYMESMGMVIQMEQQYTDITQELISEFMVSQREIMESYDVLQVLLKDEFFDITTMRVHMVYSDTEQTTRFMVLVMGTLVETLELQM